MPAAYHEGCFPPAALDLSALFPLVGPANAAIARYEGVLAGGGANPDILLAPLTAREAVLYSKTEGTQVTLGEVVEFEAQGQLFDESTPKKVARERVAKILTQKPGSADKLYALHAPEVECIAKGKARSRYEFGVKTSIAVTNARTTGGQFIAGMQALPGNPYDGHTLSGQIEQVERLTGVTVERAYVDRGYKGH